MNTKLKIGVVALLIWAAPGVAQESEVDQSAMDHSQMDHAAMGHGEMEMPKSLVLPTENDLLRVAHGDGYVEVIVGPVSLPQGDSHLRTPIQMIDLETEGWMHKFSWEMRDADGQLLPDRLLHHVNLIDPDRRELFSPIARRIMAAGRETKEEGVPSLLGYPIEAGTRVLVNAMFASLPDASYDEAYLHVRLTYTPADDPGFIRPREVYPFYLDVMGPVGDKDFPLPPGTHGMSWEGQPAISGRLLALGGHLHDYGDWIRLENVTTGKVVWEAKPEKDESGAVHSVPTGNLWWRGGVRIEAGHTYRISVQYTNPLDVPAPDAAMGAIGGAILATNAEWPAFDREDPDYVQDLLITIAKPNEAHSHGHAAAVEADETEASDEHSEHSGHSSGSN